jgi:hypothetical protein
MLRRAGRLAARHDRLRAADDRLDRYRADPAEMMLDAGFVPDAWQAEFLRARDPYNLMLCARQVGKSLAVSMLALKTALMAPDTTTIVIAQRQDQAAELLRKSVAAFYRVGAPVAVRREGVTHFELANGSRILALPGEERAVHGHTAGLLILDEAARIPDEVFHAASPQLSASKGRLVALSTAFVKSGWFFKEWTQGQGYRRWSITAKECPRHSPEFLERERRSMGRRFFESAYLNVFGDDIDAVFSAEDIAAAMTDKLKPLFPRRPNPDDTQPTAVADTLRPLFTRT